MTASICLDSSNTDQLITEVVQLLQNNNGIHADYDDKNSNNNIGGEGCSKMVIRECRICQEEDEEHDLESPCACNGTLKFAHRKCIQKWCNHKGDITCEICSQVYSPNYALPPARSNPDVMTIDIRHAWGPQIDLRDTRFLAFASAEHRFLEPDYEDYAVAIDADIAGTPSFASHKRLGDGARIIKVLQFPGFCSSAGWFSSTMLRGQPLMVDDYKAKKKAGIMITIRERVSVYLSDKRFQGDGYEVECSKY